MSCDEMMEWEEIEKEVEEVKEESPAEVPPVVEIMEEIHIESHKLIDLEKLLTGRPNLKKIEIGALLKTAAKRIIKKYKPLHKQKAILTIPASRARKENSAGKVS